MKRILPNSLKYNGLFMKMFLFTVLIIITVSAVTTWAAIRMSEQFFIERFSITNSKVMNQIKENLESFNYSIVLASNNLLQNGTIKRTLTAEESDFDRMGSLFHLGQQMNRIKSNLDAYEVGIIVTGMNGVSYATDRAYWPITDDELKKSPITKNTLLYPKRLLFQYDYRQDITGETGDERFIVASRALSVPISGFIYGSMYFSIQEKDFKKFYSNYTSNGNDVFILNREGVIVSSSQSKRIGQNADDLLSYTDELEKTPNRTINGDFMGKEHIIMMDYLPSYDMYFFNVIDKQTALGDLIDKREIIRISAIIVLIALCVVFFASRRLTNSLSSLSRQISSASQYNFHQYVDVKGTEETKQIGQAFNSMLDELHEYVEQLMQSQKEKRNAELAALQQQINPHFLYNTLASIRFMVQQGGKEEADETIRALISLLQNTLGTVSETITVQEEIENLKNYVFINQKRYGSRIRVNYFISPDCIGCSIPKLILQPFIENAFFHGFNHKTDGYINVLVWKEGDSLICEVEDNGDGMEVSDDTKLPATKRKKHLFSGIGVRNVHERIQLIYGESYGVQITSQPGEGTKVRVTMPAR
ncbi:sensor histidine kinase [Mesobacillus foraminis]|uniref:Two-component system sensor histidine kinase YesM n=1 Tax=Mesobacillus foraminis TaxID=279826 RepID=A0A4R2BHW0_9BACI|nr:sensor histidine kinase [Mesobacillus foraminis]TCN26631.1 two-component system sensor histidine kinase YesM [Mesobacillus foraminis]